MRRITCDRVKKKYIHFDVASNFSLFFFLRHFHGLKKRPRALNLLLRSSGGDRVPDPKLFARIAAPFCCFLPARKKKLQQMISENRIIAIH